MSSLAGGAGRRLLRPKSSWDSLKMCAGIE
jgi:hypothetical protein